MPRQANFTTFETGKAERLEQVRTLAAQDEAPDVIVSRGRELGLDAESIGKMYRAGRMELVQSEASSK